MSFFAVDCALCAWFRWFTSFICHFIVVWRLPALRLLCAAVSALIVSFCRWFVFFCANFSSLVMSVFIFFSAVECCLLRFVFFRIFCCGFLSFDAFSSLSV